MHRSVRVFFFTIHFDFTFTIRDEWCINLLICISVGGTAVVVNRASVAVAVAVDAHATALSVYFICICVAPPPPPTNRQQ
uniref:Putative secreted protein n=1 Tax=Anopheles marajoara TaxID=58244 RepID=A0A2M4CBS9_9DIPT